MTTVFVPEPLTAEGFDPFGEVIETSEAHAVNINQGTTRRFEALSAKRSELEFLAMALAVVERDQREFVTLRGEFVGQGDTVHSAGDDGNCVHNYILS